MPLNYLTSDDLAAAAEPEWLLAVADDDRDDIPDEAPIQRALEDAEAEIDALLSARYGVPLDAENLPAIVRSAGAALAAEALAARRSDIPLGEALKARVAQARALLGAIARGELALPGRSGRARSSATTIDRPRSLRDGANAEF